MIPPCHAHHSVPSKSAWLHLHGRYTVESEVPENDELDLFINQTVGSRVSWEGGEAGGGGGGGSQNRKNPDPRNHFNFFQPTVNSKLKSMHRPCDKKTKTKNKSVVINIAYLLI